MNLFKNVFSAVVIIIFSGLSFLAAADTYQTEIKFIASVPLTAKDYTGTDATISNSNTDIIVMVNSSDAFFRFNIVDATANKQCQITTTVTKRVVNNKTVEYFGTQLVDYIGYKCSVVQVDSNGVTHKRSPTIMSTVMQPSTSTNEITYKLQIVAKHQKPD